MNPKVRAVLARYNAQLHALGVGCRRADDMAFPGFALSHLRWMILTLTTEGESWSTRKVCRWLGFIQGSMWSAGLIGIKALRDDSRDLYDGAEGPDPITPT